MWSGSSWHTLGNCSRPGQTLSPATLTRCGAYPLQGGNAPLPFAIMSLLPSQTCNITGLHQLHEGRNVKLLLDDMSIDFMNYCKQASRPFGWVFTQESGRLPEAQGATGRSTH